MLNLLLYSVSGLVLIFFLLPTLIEVSLTRPLRQDPLNLQLDWTFFAGLVGVRLQFQAADCHLYPLILGQWFKFPRLQLRKGMAVESKTPRAPSSPVAEPDRKEPPPDEPLFERMGFMINLLLKPGLSFLRHLKKAVVLYRLRLNGCFGFDDPARTGRICGYLYGLKPFNNNRLQIDMKPDFSVPGVRGHLDLKARMHLGYLIFLALIFGVRVACRWMALRLSWLPWKPGLI